MSDGQPPFTVLDAELTSLVKQPPAEPVPGRRTRAARTREAAPDAPPAGGRQGGSQKSLKLQVRPGHEKVVRAWVERQGGRVVSDGARVLVAELPVPAIAALEGLPGVRRAEVPKVLLPRLEECRGPATGLGRALDRHGLTGEGVVLGIVDTGVDWSHPDFLDENGGSRIELFLHAYRDGRRDVSRYRTYGREALNEALQGKRKVPLGDPEGHGTHCASIAAGCGRASQGRFSGVAPGVSLMAVRSEPLLDDHTIRAIRDIFRRAGRRPAVISLSLGHHYGAHDGTASLENVIAEQSGPGRIVVVAAGNEGSDGIHWQGELVEGKDLLIPFRVADEGWQYVDVWVPRGDEVDVIVESPDGAQTPPNGEPVPTVFGICTATWRRDRVNLDSNLSVSVEKGRVNHIWNIRLRPRAVLHGEVHAWSGTANPSTSAHLFPGATDRRFSIGIPATEERAIAVASWVCRNTYDGAEGPVHTAGLEVGQLSPFSSEGPTRHGVLKPDIAAPGQYITGALAADSRMKTEAQYRQRHHPSAPYITLQGTSMATPFVAGVIALLLEREPRLTPEEIQQRLRITARRDRDTRRVWGSGFGYGKIDVEALLDYEAEEV
jgi:subtilisin family serine protease